MKLHPSSLQVAAVITGLYCLAPQGAMVLQAEDNGVSAIIGLTRNLCKAGSDTLIGVPFERNAIGGGSLAAPPKLTGLSASFRANIPAGELPAFENRLHYLRFVGPGGAAGSWHPILSHSDSTVTIEANGSNLADLDTGDTFEIIPYWTLDSLFDPGVQETIHVSAGSLPNVRSTEVLITDLTGEGINLAPDHIYFLTGSGWRQATTGFPSAGSQVILPGQVIVIRHPVGVADTYFVARQRVNLGDLRMALRTSVRGSQDNLVSLARPTEIKLSELDLTAETFLDSASTDSGDRVDELLLFDNLAAAFNKSPSVTFFRVAGTWRRDDGATFPVADDDLIPIAAAIVIRKAATEDGQPLIWINSPRY
ncbi:MAG: TIGR02597 family protein [Verrucomicrobiae bacterium]|nr:TIGR02597 family protein [Verrucomicrobiae bacterium]